MTLLEKLKAKLTRVHKSGTMWFNAVFMSVLPFIPQLQQSFPQLQPYLPENIYKTGMMIIIVGNILFRFKTTKPLEMR